MQPKVSFTYIHTLPLPFKDKHNTKSNDKRLSQMCDSFVGFLQFLKVLLAGNRVLYRYVPRISVIITSVCWHQLLWKNQVHNSPSVCVCTHYYYTFIHPQLRALLSCGSSISMASASCCAGDCHFQRCISGPATGTIAWGGRDEIILFSSYFGE